ncbi:hypothetical protein GCM10022233_72580 [Streptomyces shaanxiensis]|uniref:DUF5753 domain-containing protein n=1 Tax=Streptomyces shaanxiensis TaxID=653357 RepID=A0ABP7W583_9ACTN
MRRHPVQVRGYLHCRRDVDLTEELQHRVVLVPVDTQMPAERRRNLLHDDIASNLLTYGGCSNPVPALQVTLDRANLSMFD